MATYIINLISTGQEWLANIKTFLTVHNAPIEIHEEKTVFHTKFSAFDSFMLRFKDLDFENDHIIINGKEASSIHDMAMIFEKEFALSKTT